MITVASLVLKYQGAAVVLFKIVGIKRVKRVNNH